MELILSYNMGHLDWIPIAFTMAHYRYVIRRPYQLPQAGGGAISLSLEKTYDVFVDAEPNEEEEKNRAFNLLVKSTAR